MVGGQTVAQAHCQIERPVVVHRFECSVHAYKYTITHGGHLHLSDKLLGVDSKLWRPLADYALGKSVVQSPHFERLLGQATALAENKRFFHWELEFPDIFFDHQGQPLGDRAGFDVVIGNPPYVRQEQLGPDKPYFREHYEVYHGVADLFIYFFGQGLRLLCKNGRLAYISSNTWLRANYATPLRQYLRTQVTIETIIDMGDNRIFADAPDMTPAIQIVSKTQPMHGHTAQAAIFARSEGVISFKEDLAKKLFAISIHNQIDTGWQLTDDAPRTLFAKLMTKGKELGEVLNGHMYRGVLTGLNDVFIIGQILRDRLVKDDPSCANIIKPMLRGEDLRPWYQENEGRWLICLPNGWTMRTFQGLEPTENLAWDIFAKLHPGLAKYLEPFSEPARKRQDKGQFWWELRPCDYYNIFEQPKIFWSPIGKFPRFSWDEQGQFVNNAGFFLLPTDKSLLGILQSRTCWFCITRLCTPLGERAGLVRYQQFMQFISHLPIPLLTDFQRDHIEKLAHQLTEKAKQRYEVRQKTAHRVENDFGNIQTKLNHRLSAWWELTFQEFRAEVTKIFKHDVPLRDRDDWETFLHERSIEIKRLTEEIVRLETELNAAVYEAFGLDEAEIALIEQETKYQYGEW